MVLQQAKQQHDKQYDNDFTCAGPPRPPCTRHGLPKNKTGRPHRIDATNAAKAGRQTSKQAVNPQCGIPRTPRSAVTHPRALLQQVQHVKITICRAPEHDRKKERHGLLKCNGVVNADAPPTDRCADLHTTYSHACMLPAFCADDNFSANMRFVRCQAWLAGHTYLMAESKPPEKATITSRNLYEDGFSCEEYSVPCAICCVADFALLSPRTFPRQLPGWMDGWMAGWPNPGRRS